MEQGEKNWRVWSFGEDEKCQHVTLRAILLTCCQLRACTKGTTDGLYRKFEFQLIIKQEMKNTGYHTYTESPSENSDPYLLPRDKSGLWEGTTGLPQSSVTNSCTHLTTTWQWLWKHEVCRQALSTQAPIWASYNHYFTLRVLIPCQESAIEKKEPLCSGR